MNNAQQLVKLLTEEPDARDLGGKSRAFSLLKDAVLALLPAGSTATGKRGVFTFLVQGYGQLKVVARWVIASPNPRVQHFFGGDTIEAMASAIVLTRHQDEVRSVADKLRRQTTATRFNA